MDIEILNTIREKGLLLEKEVFDLLNDFSDSRTAKDFLENLERISGQKMINRSVLNKNVEYVRSFFGKLKMDDRKFVEKTFVKLGISLEIRREKEFVGSSPTVLNSGIGKPKYGVFYADTKPDKKLEVKDFTGHFRARFQQIQRMLMSRPQLQHNLMSIGKIGGDRQSLSLIGIVKDKRITQNKNMMITFEDLTGEIKALIKGDKEEIFEKAEELQLDDVVGLKVSGNRDIVFIQDIFFPDSFIQDKVRFDEDMSIAFLSDTHCGSDRHLSKSLEQFIEWIGSDDVEAKKIKYLFFVGDNVDGVGVFPGQENTLNLTSMVEQYEQLAGYLRRIPKRIEMFMCPGQHDASRVAEPQPIISKRYAPQLYEIDNLTLVTNPALVKLYEDKKEFKILMYHGASIHTFINEIKELRLMKAHNCPAKAVRHMLKRRHLSPTHGGMTGIYIPDVDKDPLVIEEVPDIFCTGEVHRVDVENYNGTLIITGSCWQAQTPFEEKVGNIPDPAKVPVFNLKTRELKILDFGVREEIEKEYDGEGEG